MKSTQHYAACSLVCAFPLAQLSPSGQAVSNIMQTLELIPGMSFEIELNEETNQPVIAWCYGSNGGYSNTFANAINDAKLTGRGESEAA